MTTPSDGSHANDGEAAGPSGGRPVDDYGRLGVLRIILASLFAVGGSTDVTIISNGTWITGRAVTVDVWLKELVATSRARLSPDSQGGSHLLDALDNVAGELAAERPAEADEMQHLNLVDPQMWPVGGSIPISPGHPFQVPFTHISAWTLGRASAT